MSRASWVGVLCVVVVSAVLVSVGATTAQAGLASVWAVDDGEKIFRENITSPLKTGLNNSVWDGSTVSLFAARNETVAFQLILQADGSGANTVNVTVSDLTNGGYTIKGSYPPPAPNDYIGVGVELFTEHYFNINPLSGNPTGSYMYWSSAAAPRNRGMTVGWMPDALIPFSANPGSPLVPGEGGAPFDIAASVNQGVWVDTYVHKGLPAGIYTGTITVTVGGATVQTIPVNLEVMDFTLPDENHYKSMVFYDRESVATRYDPSRLGLPTPRHLVTDFCCSSEQAELVLNYNRMAHRHRLELVGFGDWWEIDNIAGTLTGEAYTPAEGYEGPGEGIGNSLFSISTYGVSWPDTEADYRTESDAWVNWFTANAPNVDYFLYITDEPGSSTYPWIVERANWIHNNPGPGHALPVFVTKAPTTALIGAIDIWAMQPQSWNAATNAAANARGEETWAYAGYRPRTPSDVIDEWGVAFRLKPWIAYKGGIGRWFTWESTHWYRNANELNPRTYFNEWQDPFSFKTSSAGNNGNGDGTMFYPGEEYMFPGDDHGYPGPFSSIRMKMYRRGAQDYEYFWLANQAGYGPVVQNTLATLLPHVLESNVAATDWSNSNITYEQARRDLADIIVGGLPPPTVDFTGNPTTGYLPLTVSFTDQTTNYPNSWSWTFGDGGTSTVQNPSHQYTAAGSYTVTLTAANPDGSNTNTKANYVTVTVPPPPVANFIGSPTSGTAPLTVNFTDQTSNAPTSWTWSFGDGGTSTSKNPSHQYTTAGVYTVSLTVTNASGSGPDTNIKINYIIVSSGLTAASAALDSGTNYSGSYLNTLVSDNVRWEVTAALVSSRYQAQETYTFNTGMSSLSSLTVTVEASVNTGSQTQRIYLYNNSTAAWDQIDSATLTTTDSTRNVTISNPASYVAGGTVIVRVYTGGTGTSSYRHRIDWVRIVYPPAMVADFTGSPTSGVAPLTVSFADFSAPSPTSWSWDFGDGGTSTAQNPSHTYDSAGSYTVVLTASNAGGPDTMTKDNYISVAMVADFTASPTTGTAPLTVSFADSSAGNPTSWSWDFGDGASSSEQNPSHQYAHGGQYTVSLTATNDGGSDSITKTDYIAATYQFLGFLPPVVEHKPFKRGSTIPIKFRIADGAGNPVPDAVTTLVIAYHGDGAPAGQPIVASMAAGDSSEEFRYSASDDLYIYNLSTKDASYLNYYTYTATIELNDGQTYSVDFALK